jgi:hypothetical protein
MGIVSSIARRTGRFAGWAGRRVATRSRWLARRLWLVTAAEIALLSRRHWHRLEPDERRRFMELARASRGRPARLASADREELERLLDKLGHAELAGAVARAVLPLALVGRVVERFVRRGRRRARGPQGHPSGGPRGQASGEAVKLPSDDRVTQLH